MLRRPHALALLGAGVLALSLAGDARGQDDDPDDALRRPQQLTVGVANQFLGELSPDDKTLYFVSNRNTINEIYVQDLESAHARPLFDEGADVTWPRVSPDGRHLSYISFRDEATGQLCVRDLPGGGGRKCLRGGGSAVQAEWLDARRIALVTRASIAGDLGLVEVRLGWHLHDAPLWTRNLTSPAISPDGRWLVYVPIERYVQTLGPGFAARTAKRLEAVRLDRRGAAIRFSLDLPGMTGQPVFSRDGRWLYVTQFFNDTNHDGVIDGADHGVLFRVPFAGDRDDAPARAAAAMPEQLTDASWNCQYPAPAGATLITTCSHGKELDIYDLPLDGEVPSKFDAARLRAEIDVASRRIEELLLYRHLLRRETDAQQRRRTMLRLARLHLEFDEFDAAAFYAAHVRQLKDAATAGIGRVLAVFVEHRRALRDRERGHIAPDFADDERQRLAAAAPQPGDSAAGVALAHIVRSEIADGVGDKSTARAELDAVDLAKVTPPSVLLMYYDRADALYRELDDGDALVAACRRLATHPALGASDRLTYARAMVRALVRGLGADEADARLARARADEHDPELDYALDLGRAVLSLRDDHPPQPTIDAIVALYRAQTRPDRRRALMLDVARRASQLGADRVLEALAQRYVDDAPAGTQERRRAERFYRRILQSRAYRRWGQGRRDEARADFEAVAKETGSDESFIGAVELGLRAGEPVDAIEADVMRLAHARKDAAIVHFVKAYLMARRLPKLTGKAHRDTVAAALAELRAGWPELKRKRAPQALFGAILHERFLEDGDVAAAQRANSHYRIALDLVRNNPRYAAMVLGQLGLLHTQVGNYRIALSYLEQREKYPFVDNSGGLAVRLAKARCLLHIGQEKQASQAADEALEMTERAPKLARYRLLALDRAALYALSADRFERALSLYDTELPLLDAATGPASRRNRMVARLARAAAALGAGRPTLALGDLGTVERDLGDPKVTAELAWPYASRRDVLRAYGTITYGLLANARRRLGQLDEAGRALAQRRTLVAERLARQDRDQDLQALALVEARLADNARDRGDAAAAARWAGQALDDANAFLRRTHTPVDHAELDVLWLAAALRASTGVALPFNLLRQLRRAYQQMAAQNDKSWRPYERWFEIYLALFSRLRRRGHADAGDVLDPIEDQPAEPGQTQTRRQWPTLPLAVNDPWRGGVFGVVF